MYIYPFSDPIFILPYSSEYLTALEIKLDRTIRRAVLPISRFGGGDRTTKKQGVIEKFKSFFEQFFGIGGSFTTNEPNTVNDD